jgi:syntaxin 1B/2/3
MSQSYQQYGGNPYGQAEAGYGQSNPYGGSGYGSSNPYGGAYDEQPPRLNPPASLQHGDSNYSQPSQYSQGAAMSPAHSNAQHVPHTDVPMSNMPGHSGAPVDAPMHAPMEQPGSQPMNKQDFFQRIEGVKQRIGMLTQDIAQIGTVHQRMLSSPDSRSSAELESIVSNTQIRNTQIKDEIKFLERDAARDSNDRTKRTQVEALKRQFKTQLEEFQKEEADYSKRYREAIGRQYRIVNPDATEEEVNEVANADLGDEGIFTQAVSSSG